MPKTKNTVKQEEKQTEEKQTNGQAEPSKISVLIRPIKFELMTVKIKGLTDLVTHAWSEKARKEMLDAQQGKKPVKSKREHKNPEKEFNGAKYKTRSGQDALPAIALKGAIIDSADFVGDKIPKRILAGSVWVMGDKDQLVPIKYTECEMREDMVRIGPFTNRVADLRYRPGYKNWTAEVTIRYRADILRPEHVVTLLQNAGFSVGVGEWRPQRRGQYGMFEVVNG